MRNRLLGRCGLALLLDQAGDQPRPARLVAGTEADAAVAMEVLMEQDQIAPVGVLLEDRAMGIDGALSSLPRQEQGDQAPPQLLGHLLQREEPA